MRCIKSVAVENRGARVWGAWLPCSRVAVAQPNFAVAGQSTHTYAAPSLFLFTRKNCNILRMNIRVYSTATLNVYSRCLRVQVIPEV